MPVFDTVHGKTHKFSLDSIIYGNHLFTYDQIIKLPLSLRLIYFETHVGPNECVRMCVVRVHTNCLQMHNNNNSNNDNRKTFFFCV